MPIRGGRGERRRCPGLTEEGSIGSTVSNGAAGGRREFPRELRRELGGLREAVPLAPYCAYAVGGPAEFLFEAATTAELRRAVVAGRQSGVPVTVLGQATNVLIADGGLPGLVVLARNAEADVRDELLTCGAGAVLAPVVATSPSAGSPASSSPATSRARSAARSSATPERTAAPSATRSSRPKCWSATRSAR